MKWLFFVLLIACQNKSPAYKDLSDNDGDGIRDIDEIQMGSNPLISEIKTLPLIEISLESPDFKMTISNKFDLEKGLAVLAAKPTLPHVPQDLLVGKRGLIESQAPTQKSYDLNLFLNKDSSEKVTLRLGHRRIELTPGLKLTLSQDEILKLNSGSLEATFSGEYEKRIKEIQDKTYKVIYVSSHSSNLFYVSKNLSFQRFLKERKLDIPKEMPLKDLFFLKDNSEGALWKRQIGEDIILFEGTLHDLHLAYLKNFNVFSSQLTRTNGQGISESVKLKASGKSFLRLKGESTNRNFLKTVAHYGCNESGTVVTSTAHSESPKLLSLNAIKENIVVLNPESMKYYQLDNDLIVDPPASLNSLNLGLTQRPEETFEESNYQIETCFLGRENIIKHPERLNREVEFKLNITTYLEKD